MSASRLGAEDGGGACVGVDAGEVGGSEGEAAIRVVNGGGVVEEEGAVGSVETAIFSAKDESAKLKAGIYVGEKGRQICSEAAVLEVEQAAYASAGGYGLEEASGGLVA